MALQVSASDSPLGKRIPQQLTPTDEGFRRYEDGGSPLKRASPSPAARRPNSFGEDEVGQTGAEAPEANRDAQVIDDILSMAFKLEREAREAEEDEKLPGVMGRVATQTKRRARRQSKQLEANFQELMSEALEKAFQRFDTDGSGNLDAQELKAAFEAAGRPSDDETIRKAIEALDTDNDGLISLEEFRAIAWKVSTF